MVVRKQRRMSGLEKENENEEGKEEAGIEGRGKLTISFRCLIIHREWVATWSN